MDASLKREIEQTVKQYGISREDIEMDLDTRENYPGEFYVMPLMGFGTESLRLYLEETA